MLTGHASPHFTWDELQRASSCQRGDLPIRAIKRLLRVYLEPIRVQFGPVQITSSCRSAARNLIVGGAPHSYHRYSLRPGHAALDFRCATGTAREWDDSLLELGATWVEGSATHSHIDTRRWSDL